MRITAADAVTGRSRLIGNGRLLGNVRGEFAQHELLQDSRHAALAQPDKRVLKKQSGAAIAGRIVGVGKGSGGKAADDAGIVRLPLLGAIVAGDDRVFQRVGQARFLGARALVEISRVLMEDGRQNGTAYVGAEDHIAVSRADSLAITRRTLTIASGLVGCLLDSGKE